MIRSLCVVCVVIAVFWALFNPFREFNIEIALDYTASINDRINPLEFVKEFAGNISADANNAVAGFHRAAQEDTVLAKLKAGFSALGQFFENAFYIVLDLTITPMIFVVDCFVTLYNLCAVWLGFPTTSVWIPLISRTYGGQVGGR